MLFSKFKFALLSLVLVSIPNLVLASRAFYLTEPQRIDWVKETDQPGIYKIYGQFKGKYDSRKVRKEELSFAADSVDGIKIGWALIWSETTNTFDHCFVDSLFENGKAFSFCDLMQGERAIRKHYEANANQMVGQVDSISSLHKGEDARMKNDSAGYRKGDTVKIKALFINNMALVLKESVGSFLQGGPYYNAISKVISIEDLEE